MGADSRRVEAENWLASPITARLPSTLMPRSARLKLAHYPTPPKSGRVI
jgi:hypothetical protein